MEIYAFYVVKDSFFEDVDDPYLKHNKGGRPHFYSFYDDVSNLFWLIPSTTKLEKYKAKVEERLRAGRPCDIIHIGKLDSGNDCVFLIQDMFPITPNYIERGYTIGGNHLKVTSQSLIDEINKKAKNILGLIRRGIKLNPKQPNVLKIEQYLLNKNKQ